MPKHLIILSLFGIFSGIKKLLLSDFDHLNYDDQQAKNIITLSVMFKINHNYIHKIIKSMVLKIY